MMNRFTTFLLGLTLGAVLMSTAMNYHVVRSVEGTHLIPKTEAKLGGTYADIRHYQHRDWLENPALAKAIVAQQHRLQERPAGGGIDRLIRSVIAMVTNRN